MLTLKPTASLILVRLFQHGTPFEGENGRAVRWTEGLGLLVPGTHPKALSDAAADLETGGLVRSMPGQPAPGRRGRPPRTVIADFEIAPGIREQDRIYSSFGQKTEANSESEPSRARAGLTAAAAAAHPYYLRLVKVFRTEGVVDPETQVSAFGIGASLAAANELRARRLAGMVITAKPRNVLCHFGEKYRGNPPEVPDAEQLLAYWERDETERVRAIK